MQVNDLKTNDAPDLPYSLRFEERDAYLYVAICGEKETLQGSLATWAYIASECRKRGYKKLFVEEDLRSQLSMLDMYRFTDALPRLGFIGIKLAVFDRQPSDHPENMFGETVAVNRGVSVKVFIDFDAAEKWLITEN